MYKTAPDGWMAAFRQWGNPPGGGKSGLHGNTVPGNARRGRPQGKCHRKQTAGPSGHVPGDAGKGEKGREGRTAPPATGAARDRKSVVYGKRVAVSEEPGGRRHITEK